jgi:hypothetical protein
VKLSGAVPRRTAVMAIAALTGVLFLGGCGEDGDEYCQTLAEEQKTLTTMADDSAEGSDVLTPTLDSFERLRAVAPEELQGEWDTLTAAYDAVVDTVNAAGIDPAEYDPEDPPADMSAEDAERLAAVASKLSSTRVSEAAAGIQDHAAEVCEVDFKG